MSKKFMLLIFLYCLLFYFAGNSLLAVLFLISVPVLTYVCIKFFIIEAPGNFLANLLYGEKTLYEPRKELSHIHMLMVNENYTQALNSLNAMEEQCFEVEKLKMKLLYDHLNRPAEALQIGLEILNAKKFTIDHAEVLGNCVEIYIDAGNLDYAQQCLQMYGPKLPSQNLVNDKIKRLNALQG